MDIEANLRTYLGQRGPTARYTSFDYCYNHFQLHRERGVLSKLVVGPNMQLAPLGTRKETTEEKGENQS